MMKNNYYYQMKHQQKQWNPAYQKYLANKCYQKYMAMEEKKNRIPSPKEILKYKKENNLV